MKKFVLLCVAFLLGVATMAAGLYAGVALLRETSVMSSAELRSTTSVLLLLATCALILASVRMAKARGSDN